MHQTVATAAHCINPNCHRPYPQNIGNNFCSICGSSLRLKDRYIPLERLGFGGFAAIYSVWDLKSQTEKVIKVLLETSPKALAMFEQEAMVLANLRHPGVPRVELDGYFQVILGNSHQILMPCLVMEKIAGHTLQDILDQYPHGCPEGWVLNWLKQAVEILRELHLRKIIHRDIKPSNLMLRSPLNKGGNNILTPLGKGENNILTPLGKGGNNILASLGKGGNNILAPLGKGGLGGSNPQNLGVNKEDRLVLIDFGGAKQISPVRGHSQASSTRLFSPGYSPPEQLAGGVVKQTADFYALGMTCIHLLTGKYPPDLEDPSTGELKWRQYTKVNPALAILLDEMVRSDEAQRPPNAREIIKRLNKIARKQLTLGLIVAIGWELSAQTWQISLHLLWGSFAIITKVIKSLIITIYRVIIHILKGCFGTILGMLGGGIGGALGAGAGFWLIEQLPSNLQLTSAVLENGNNWIYHIGMAAFKPQMIVFAIAGLGTAWGLVLVKSLGQKRRRFLISGIMGILGYSIGYLIVQRVASNGAVAPNDLVNMTAVVAGVLTFGLGLPSHNLAHSLIATFGTASVFAWLVSLISKFLSFTAIFGFSNAFFTTISWTNFGFSVTFFSLLGIILGLFLGISSYLLVPFLRLLGWR